jgi:hypothetical protein
MHWDEIVKNLPALFGAAFLAVLFIQSGLDKVFDWKGNLEWLTGHFSKTFLAGMVPIMLGTITATELATGFVSAAGVIYFFATGSTGAIFYGAAIGAASITALFFGQRIAKDYPGAAVLVPYFLLTLAVMYLASGSIK